MQTIFVAGKQIFPRQTHYLDVNSGDDKEAVFKRLILYEYYYLDEKDRFKHRAYWSGVDPKTGKETNIKRIHDQELNGYWGPRIVLQKQIDERRKEEALLKLLKRLLILNRTPTMGEWSKNASKDPADVSRKILGPIERAELARRLL